MNDETTTHGTAPPIPIPNTISAEAQSYLSLMTTAPRTGGYSAETPEGWTALAARGDAIMAEHAARTGAGFLGRIDRHAVGGFTIYEITPNSIAAQNRGRAVLYVHGGAYLFGGGDLSAAMALQHAQRLGCKVYAPDYRMPPTYLFPFAIDDVLSTYGEMLKTVDARRLGVIGLSAGGGIAAAMVLKARDQGLPLPGALILLSPEADLSEAGDSFRACAFPMTFVAINAMYANGEDLKHPYLSPLYGDFTKGYPPTMLQAGTRDFFLSNCALLHRRLRNAGVDAELHIWEAMPHGGFGGLTAEDQDVLDEQERFLNRTLAQ